MPEFRLTQISDPHLATNRPKLVANFDRVCEHIDAARPDLVINTGDMSYDGVNNPAELIFAKGQHDALPVKCRYIPGNHDVGDNPANVGSPAAHPITDKDCVRFASIFGDARWCFDAAGWRFIGVNAQLYNSGLDEETEQSAWFEEQLAGIDGKPLALFVHKPLFFHQPDEEEQPETGLRFIPPPARSHLIELLSKVDLRLVASGHVHQRRDFTYRGVRHIWAPSTGFVIRAKKAVGIQEVGLIEYRFAPNAFEVRHIRAPGQVDIDLSEIQAQA